MHFRFGAFLSHVIKTTLSRHPSTERKLSQVSTRNGIPSLHESTKETASATGHNIKWDHFDILAKSKTGYHRKIKETLFIQELEPAFNVNVGSEKLMLY